MGKVTGYSYLPQPFQDPESGLTGEIYRPMIAIRISRDHGQISHYFDALIDSGSDRNLFPIQFATGAGIQFKKIKPRKIFGIGGSYIEAYSAKINIWVGIKKYQTEADFSPQQMMPLLGRDGFFSLFGSVKFDELAQFV